MTRIARVGVLVCLAALTAAGAEAEKSKVRLGKPVRQGAFEVSPVYGREAPAAADYLLLAEGLRTKMVKIEERAGGGRVPELLLHNRSRRPLLLVSGEVVYGGKQDRVIREDTIIPPLAMNVPISVFCVERGRWGGGRTFGKTGGFALPKVMKAANFRAQGEVWRAVHEEAAKAKARGDAKAVASTGTLQAVLQSRQAKRDAKPFVATANRILRGRRLPIGFVVALGGKPQAAHLFASSGLAYKLSPALLRSYALDAARSAAPAKRATKAAVRAFLDEALRDRGRVHRDGDAVQNLTVSGALGEGKATVDKKRGRTVHRFFFAR